MNSKLTPWKCTVNEMKDEFVKLTSSLEVQGNTHNDYLRQCKCIVRVTDTAFTIQAKLYITHSLTANRTYNRLPTYYVIANTHQAQELYKLG